MGTDRNLYTSGKSVAAAGLWKGRKLLLQQIDIELTERCNNNCVHCFINLPLNDPEARKRELSSESVKTILQEAADLGCLTVQLTGGEPLLREDFEEIYRYARNLGMRVRLLTNGTLITSDVARLFACIPPLEPIEITVYGMARASYEGVTRVAGSYGAAWRGIGLLEQERVPYILKGVYLAQNRNELKDFDTYCMKLPNMGRRPALVIQLDLRCRHDSKRKNNRICALRTPPAEVVRIIARGDGREYKEMMRTFCARYMGNMGTTLFTCGAGVGRCVIDAYGVIQPCVWARHPEAVYFWRHGSLREVMSEFFPDLRQRKADLREYIDRCGKCFIRGLCEQCPGKSWTEHGSLDTPVDYHCEVAHESARYLGLLDQDEQAWRIIDGKRRVDRLISR